MEQLIQSVRLGLRRTRSAPGFALTAILTLALGIGLSTAVFTVAEALLLRRLPIHDQDRVVALWGQMRARGFDHYPLSLDDAREFVARTATLESAALAAYEGACPASIHNGTDVTRLSRAIVSGKFFDVLGASPALGRALRAEDDVSGAAPVAVLSHGAWLNRFGGSANVLGRRLLSYDNGVTYTIVGVMARGVDYPRGVEMWAPILSSVPARNLQYVAVDVIGRLAPTATGEQARGELDAFFRRAGGSPWQREVSGVVHSLPRLVLGDVRPALLVFAAAAGLLLLITCINVANLLLVRGLERRREIAVRSALGAGRTQLVSQLLAENAILAIGGGAMGIALADGAVRMFVSLAPANVPRLDEIHLNATALSAALAITIVATLLFSLAPAVMTSRTPPQETLRADARQSASRKSRFTVEGLVAVQIALALVVLSAAGLIGRSLLKLQRAELSLQPSGVLIAQLAARFDRYDDVTKQRALFDRLLPAVQGIPGVRAMSPVVAVPFSGTGGWDGRPASEGQTAEQAGTNVVLNMEVVGADYFKTFGIPLIRGRAFTATDREDAPRVVIVSQSAARHYWPNGEAIGKRLGLGTKLDDWFTVVGVVPDTRYRDLRVARPSIYFPLRQPFFPFAPTTLAILSDRSPADLTADLRRVVAETAPGVAVASAAPFASFLDRPLAQPRLNALLLGVFAAAAVALAAVGLFGVMATMVRQRTRELGVRMVLGATARDLRRMVMGRSFVIAGAGAAIGLVGALFANRLLAAMFYDVGPTDAPTLAAVTTLLLVVAAIASFVPARASTRIDPADAMRAEG